MIKVTEQNPFELDRLELDEDTLYLHNGYVYMFNQGGFDHTIFELQELMDWLKTNKPGLLK